MTQEEVVRMQKGCQAAEVQPRDLIEALETQPDLVQRMINNVKDRVVTAAEHNAKKNERKPDEPEIHQREQLKRFVKHHGVFGSMGQQRHDRSGKIPQMVYSEVSFEELRKLVKKRLIRLETDRSGPFIMPLSSKSMEISIDGHVFRITLGLPDEDMMVFALDGEMRKHLQEFLEN